MRLASRDCRTTSETDTPRLGAHMSIASGLHHAFARLRDVGGNALQIFLKNQRQWVSPPLAPTAVKQFLTAWEDSGCPPVAAHDSYLVNLASSSDALVERSVQALADELRRAAMLRIPYLVVHPGSHGGTGFEAGLERLVRNMDRGIASAEVPEVVVLIENTAGQGAQLGARFEEVASIFATSRFPDRLGMCFDTAHAFAAGYDLNSRDGTLRTLEDLDRTVGLAQVKLFHLNDSRKNLGSRVDRHEHIGQGRMGLEGFRVLLNDCRFAGLPMVIETPKENGLEKDRMNLKTLRGLFNPRPYSHPPRGSAGRPSRASQHPVRCRS